MRHNFLKVTQNFLTREYHCLASRFIKIDRIVDHNNTRLRMSFALNDNPLGYTRIPFTWEAFDIYLRKSLSLEKNSVCPYGMSTHLK
jgi:hypothetical protein